MRAAALVLAAGCGAPLVGVDTVPWDVFETQNSATAFELCAEAVGYEGPPVPVLFVAPDARGCALEQEDGSCPAGQLRRSGIYLRLEAETVQYSATQLAHELTHLAHGDPEHEQQELWALDGPQGKCFLALLARPEIDAIRR